MVTKTGTAGADDLFGTDASDILKGLGGNDQLTGGKGADTLDGGAGTDTARYDGSAAGVTADLLIGAAAGGQAQGDRFVGIENLTGSRFADTLSGNASANALAGLAGDDTLRGGGGNDQLAGGAGRDTLDGGAGIDTAHYEGAAAGVNVDLFAGVAFDGDGDFPTDSLVGVENAVGSAFGDDLFGDNGANRLDGGKGADFLFGDKGDDVLKGGAGDDELVGREGADVLDGGAGVDEAEYIDATGPVTVNLASGEARGGGDAGDTLVGIENIQGSLSFGDTLFGDGRANRLGGEGGNDVLGGGGGDDVLLGGFGADVLSGGTGADRLAFGSTGHSGVGSAGRDFVNDFRQAEGDKIDLSGIDAFPGGGSANDAFEFLGKGPTIDAPGQVEFVFEGGNTVVHVNTEGGNAPEMEIELLGQVNLTAGDFLL